MIHPWFDPNTYAWIPGTVLGIVAAVMGGLVGWLVPQGKARRFVLTFWTVIWVVSLLLLIAGVIALSGGQPYGVWYGLLLPGVVGTLVIGGNFISILMTYRKVEERRLAAKDLL